MKLDLPTAASPARTILKIRSASWLTGLCIYAIIIIIITIVIIIKNFSS